MCMFSPGDFLNLFYIFCWVATKWRFFLLGGRGHGWATLRLRLKMGIVSGWGILKFKCFGGTFDTYILRKGYGAK